MTEVRPTWQVSSTITLVNYEGSNPSKLIVFAADGTVLKERWLPKSVAALLVNVSEAMLKM